MKPTDTIPRVSVIIVAYNAGEWLQQCVRSVADQTLTEFECFIVDNGSSDGSVEALTLPDARFEIIDAGSNLGFAAANNLAAQKARAPWLALLNPDAFAGPDWLDIMLSTPGLGETVTMVGARLNMALEPGVLDGLGDFYHVNGLAWRGGHLHPADRPIADLQPCFGPCAAAALYDAKTFRDIGGFDESFFCYHEDVDLAFRMRLAGGTALQNNRAVVEHISSGITGRASDFAVYHGTRNRIATFVKNMPGLWLWILLPAHIALNILLLIWAAFRSGRFRATLRGVRDGLARLPATFRARRAIQAARQARDTDVIRAMTVNPRTAIRRDVPETKD